MLVWPDSAWSVRVLGGYAGQLFPEPIVSPYSTHHVVNVVEEFPSGLDWVTWTDISYDGIAVPETVMTTVNNDTEFGAAIQGGRRWVARCHQLREPPHPYRLDVSYSDTAGTWRPLPSRGNADPRMCTIAPL